jgi:hypothetical protein
MIPKTIGNMVGGGLFVGAIYWCLYVTSEGDMEVSFDLGGQASAMEAGGPMVRDGKLDMSTVIEGMPSHGEMARN